MLFRNQSGDRAGDRFIPASFARFDRAMVRTLLQTRIHQPLFKTDVESLVSHAQCNFFARPIRKCGNKPRQPEVSAAVTQLLVSNKSTPATGNVSVVSNRYESPYAAAGPGFSPEAEPFFARPAVGDDLH